MRLSVIIPAINEASSIATAVESAAQAGFDETIVVDGGSEDETAKIAAQCGANVLYGERGRATQQNLGAQHATGDVLLFLHADNWLDSSVGQQVKTCLAEPNVLAGAFRQRIEAAGVGYRLLERGNAARVQWRGLAYGDQAIFMRRATFDQLGGFPEVQLMEDLLLMRSFQQLGRVRLLAGPVHVNPRRWRKRGIIRQTLSNWALVFAEKFGVSPDRLAEHYPTHDRI